MRIDRTTGIAGIVVLTAAILSCDVLGGTSTRSAPTAGQPTAAEPTASRVSVDIRQTVNPATETPEPPTPEPATPSTGTPVQGPAIAHLTAAKPFEVGYIHMVDAQRGWGIGGFAQAQDHVLRTDTGGQTWRDVTPPEPIRADGSALAALGYFKDGSRAWIAYGPADPGSVPTSIRVWFTSDGGTTWDYGVVDSDGVAAEAFVPLYLDFPDTQHGRLLVLLGGGMNHAYSALYSTDDGGKSWTNTLDPSTDNAIQSFEKTGMIFQDARTGWLTRDAQGVDSTPHIIETVDGGASWTRIDLPAPTGTSTWFDQHACGTYSPVAFSGQSVLVLVKCLDTATFKVEQDYLYATGDGGQTWQLAPLPGGFIVADPPAGGLFFIDKQRGLALGRWIYRTDDGGKTWSAGKQVGWDGQFSFVDLKTGWAVARNAGQIALVTTTDGGQTWQEIRPVIAP